MASCALIPRTQMFFRVAAATALLLGACPCACSVQPGLANAPQLGESAMAHPRVHDAIADGPDSCGQGLDPGPLRSRMVQCPAIGHVRRTTTPNLPSAPDASTATPSVLFHSSRLWCARPEHSFLTASKEDARSAPLGAWNIPFRTSIGLFPSCPAIEGPALP